MEKPILLIPEKMDIEFEQVVDAWTQRGGQMRKLGKYWIKHDDLTTSTIAIYGNQTFAFVLAQIYNVSLSFTDDSLIARIDNKWIKRSIEQKKIGEILDNDFPAFIKPVVPKLFLASKFINLADFQLQVTGLGSDEETLVSNIVNIQAEARSFILNGEIKDLALYEGAADIEAGKEFLKSFLAENNCLLPKSVVVDIAFAENIGWFILEFNASWGAGLNNCDAKKVIDCIIAATENQ